MLSTVEDSSRWMVFSGELGVRVIVADTQGESFAEQLGRLFKAVRKGDGSTFAPREVAEQITARRSERGDNVTCSKSYMYALLNGQSEPSHAIVRAIAEVFGVELDYFSNTPRARRLAQQYDVLAGVGDGALSQIVHRASQLSAKELAHVLEIIDFEYGRHSSGGSDG